MEDPHEPQYGGGMVENPGLNEGLKGWNAFGGADIEHRVSERGNSFIVASNRSKPHASVSQSFYLLKDMLYSFSGIFLSIIIIINVNQFFNFFNLCFVCDICFIILEFIFW